MQDLPQMDPIREFRSQEDMCMISDLENSVTMQRCCTLSHLRVPMRIARMLCSEMNAASPGLKSPCNLLILRSNKASVSLPNSKISWKSSVLSNMKVKMPPRLAAGSADKTRSTKLRLGVLLHLLVARQAQISTSAHKFS